MTNLREALRAAMEESAEPKLTLSGIARSVGISTGYLSQWLGGKEIPKVEAAIAAFLQRLGEKKRAPMRKVSFVKTSVARRVFDVSRIAHLESEIGVCYGDAGIGKTAAIKEYARQEPDVLLVEVSEGHTAKVLFSELHRLLGADGTGSIYGMFEDVVTRLRGSGRLIIIDEAEHLPYRALELLRRVHDKAEVGILLVGMPRLIYNLRGKSGEFAQLYSRVGVAAKLTRLTPEDTTQIGKTVFPNLNGLSRTFFELSKGSARTLSKLLNRSLKIAELNGSEVTEEVVQAAAEFLIF